MMKISYFCLFVILHIHLYYIGKSKNLFSKIAFFPPVKGTVVQKYARYPVHLNSSIQTIHNVSSIYFNLKACITKKVKNSSLAKAAITIHAQLSRHAEALRSILTSEGTIEKNPGPKKRPSTFGGRKSADAQRKKRSRSAQASNSHDSELNQSFVGSLFDTEPCTHCNARLFIGEPPGFCWDKGKLCFLPLPPEPPAELKDLYENRQFMENIRTYNNAFAFASMGCSESRTPGYSPTVKIHGKVHHFIGSLVPANGEQPEYAQLYFYDPQHEMASRLSLSSLLKSSVVEVIQKSLHAVNPFAKEIRSAAATTNGSSLAIVLKSDGTKVTCTPTCDEIAGIFQNPEGQHLDVVFRTKEGQIKKINELHRFYDPLHYVLLFPFGTDGYHLDLKYPNKVNAKNVSGMSYYKYLLQERSSDGSLCQNVLLHSRRLSQQYAVDQFAKIESSRMNWHRYNQKQLRADKYQGLVDSVNSTDNFAPGRRIILPPSYYGSPRWYIEQFNDAMSIVRKFGKPDLFITFTCNPRWKEILDSLGPNEKPEDRPDLCVRVFHAKMRLVIKLLTKDQILGKVVAFTCMKEDQKRGLPHCHMLLIMHKDHKPRTPEDVDKIISAEIPNKEEFPELFEIITQHMIHGPCGQLDPNRPCMEGQGNKETCSKSFPKPVNNYGTTLSDNSYPNYMRRDPAHGGHTTMRTIKGKTYTIDNRWVVPYSPKLSSLFGAHVNVEIVVTVKAVKYLYKYITKGADKVLFAVNENGVLDEISNFGTARYISATEAFWRIYGFEIMNKYPAVQKLALHLPDEQYVVLTDDEASDTVEKGPPVTTLTAYFELNQTDPKARRIAYPDICQYYRFTSGKWIKRQRNNSMKRSNASPQSDTIERIPIITLNPKQSELFYLRMLLYHVPGVTDFDQLKVVNGVSHSSFKEACRAKGLLSDDRELDEIMIEGSNAQFGGQLRHLFGTILAHMTPQDPVGLWEKYKDVLCVV